jgi:hypothetical protein
MSGDRFAIFMPMSVRCECPVCVGGIGVARRARIVAEKPGVTVTLVCEACGHEWGVQHESEPHSPPVKPPDDKKAAS